MRQRQTLIVTSVIHNLQLLLIVWKTLLACLGGLKDIRKAVALQRDLAGLPPVKRGESIHVQNRPTGLQSQYLRSIALAQILLRYIPRV